MAGQRNKNAFKFLLQLLILSQKHILDVNTVVLGWFRCGLGWFGGGLGWFGVFWGGLGCFHGPTMAYETWACKSRPYLTGLTLTVTHSKLEM